MFQIFKAEYEYQLLSSASLDIKNQGKILLLIVSW